MRSLSFLGTVNLKTIHQTLWLFAVACLLSSCATDLKTKMLGMNAQELLTNARTATSSGKYEEALKYYDQIEARYPYSVFSRQSLLDQAHSYYQQSEDSQSLAIIERFLRLYPNQLGTDYAYYLRGLIHYGARTSIFDFLVDAARSRRDSAASKKAYASFNKIITEFPQSSYVADAKVRMAVLYNQMGQYDVNLARFYFERDAFVAAATRANLALQTHPRAQSQEDALVILAASYNRLNLVSLRDDTMAILNKNYPNHNHQSFIFNQ